MKQTALLLVGIIIILFSKDNSTSLFRYICKFSVLLLFKIFLYIIQPSAKSLLVDSVFLHVSFTFARNSSGPRTLPCGTPDVTLTSSDNCPPTLTLCVLPRRNSPIHTTTSSPPARPQYFVSNRSWGTKSKAFEKSIIILSVLPSLSSESAIYWQTVITWL
jgi:hypothetical protein